MTPFIISGTPSPISKPTTSRQCELTNGLLEQFLFFGESKFHVMALLVKLPRWNSRNYRNRAEPDNDVRRIWYRINRNDLSEDRCDP